MFAENSAHSIRRFFRDLFVSHHVKYLESELIRMRHEFEGRERALVAEKLDLVHKLDKVQNALLAFTPIGQRLFPPERPRPSTVQFQPEVASWKQALEAHNRALQEEEKKDGNA